MRCRLAVAASCLMLATGVMPARVNAEDNASVKQAEQSIDRRFIGHYYLSGVMETGSEMLLKADGTYDWMLVVGGMDLFSKGTWARKGDSIVLIPTPTDKSAPLFSIGKIEPWNEAAEENAQEDAMEQRNAVRVEQCPFLRSNDGDVSTDSAVSTPYLNVTPEMIAAAAQAATDEAAARTAYENAAAKAMADRNDEMHELARLARLEWRQKWNHLRLAQHDAKLQGGLENEPKLPAECVLDQWPVRPGDIAKNDWIGGVAVHVGDPDRGMYFNGVDVRFGFESGVSLERVTRSGGIAWVPRAMTDRVTSITILGKEDLANQEYRLPIEPIPEGFVSINFDSEVATQPAFSEMPLIIDGDTLIGFDGRGIYSRP